MNKKKLSTSDKVDLFVEKFYEKYQGGLGPEALDQIYWLYDNNIEFTLKVDKNQHTTLAMADEDFIGFKLRWN